MRKKALLEGFVEEIEASFPTFAVVKKRDVDFKELITNPKVYSFPACFVSYANSNQDRVKKKSQQFERETFIKLGIAFKGFYEVDDDVDLDYLDDLQDHFNKLQVPGYECCTAIGDANAVELNGLRVYEIVIRLEETYELKIGG